MHDMLVDGMAGLISFVKEKLGDEGVREAWEWSLERSWKRRSQKIDAIDRRTIAQSLAATWRGHSTGGVGPNPGAFEISEDEEKLTFTMNPCGSGQRLVRNGRYGPDGWGVTDAAHDWSYGREGLPALLHPLRVHERAGADQLDRLPGLSLGAARGLRA